MQRYYQILGLDANATLPEIKKAYRKKAKLFHPDHNKDEDAKNRFIEITEAYDYLSNLKTKGLAIPSRTRHSFTREDLIKKRRESARKKAQEMAKMRYEEWINSEYYKIDNALGILFAYFLIALTLVSFIALPVYMYKKDGASGLFFSFIILLVLSPFSIYLLKNYWSFSFADLKGSIRTVSKNKKMTGFILAVINAYLLIRIGFQTMLPLLLLLPLYIVLPLCTYAWLRFNRKIKNSGYISYCMAPLALNIFLLLNYLVSFNPQQESYNFSRNYQRVYSRYGTSSTSQVSGIISLPGNKYEEYAGIRIFNDYREIINSVSITYTFKTGLFGIRVMKDYSFNNFYSK